MLGALIAMKCLHFATDQTSCLNEQALENLSEAEAEHNTELESTHRQYKSLENTKHPERSGVERHREELRGSSSVKKKTACILAGL